MEQPVSDSSKYTLPALAALFYFLLFLFSKSVPFFWDTILFASRVPHFFFENGFSNLIPPDAIDSGHPPFYSMLVAAVWKIFGRALWTGHALTAIFSFLLAVQWIKLCRKFLPKGTWLFGLLLLFFEPTLLGQSVLVSPEIPLLFFLFWGLNKLLARKYKLAIIPLSLLALISTRGSVWLLILFLFIQYNELKIEKQEFSLRLFFPFILPGLLSVSWLYYHYTQTGWMALNPNGNWTATTANSGFLEIFRNLFFLGHRFVDFGRLLLVGTCAVGAWNYRKYFQQATKKQKRVQSFLLIGILIIGGLTIIKTNSTLHRYYIPLYLMMGILALQYLVHFKSKSLRTGLLGLTFAGMLLGNLWVYPHNIAQGWDGSLAFLFGLNSKDVVEQEFLAAGIKKGEIATLFPLRRSNYILKLNDDRSDYLNFSSTQDAEYILWSNLSNDFSDDFSATLKERWTPIHSHCQLNACVVLYQRPNN